jgi:hypothetical protein
VRYILGAAGNVDFENLASRPASEPTHPLSRCR